MSPERCPICGCFAKVLFEAVDENHRVGLTRFPYAKCDGCQTIFLTRIPNDIARYYETTYYEIPSPTKLKKLAAKNRGRINTVLKFARRGRLLEIGPAYGVFALQAKEAGFEVDALEMDVRCCEYLEKVVGVNAIRSNTPHAAIENLGQHNVIALWHVLEHLAEPLALLGAVSANLAPGGILVIGVPNPQALQFRLMGRHWPHLDAPRHAILIPARTLSSTLRSFGVREIHRTSNDAEIRYWNRFGWERLLMNRFSNNRVRSLMRVLGFALGVASSPLECQDLRGSAYTAVFQKDSSA